MGELAWWLSNSRMTFQVNTDLNEKIIWAAPIARKFLGQSLENLERWAGVKARLLYE